MTGTTTTAVPVAERARVGWGDLVWLTWRQHRWAIAGLLGASAAAILLALGLAWHVGATGDTSHLVGRWRFVGLGQTLMLGPMVIGLVIAVFWAAPLLSREYEQRTHLLVWSQDVSPTRWLAGKVVALGVPASAAAVGLGLAVRRLITSTNTAMSGYAALGTFETPAYETAPVVQVGYAVFGFALGVALSAVTRRTVLSMGLTLGLFLAVRAVVSGAWRPHFREPLRVVEPYDPTYAGTLAAVGDNALIVSSGFADSAGNEVAFPAECSNVEDNLDYTRCVRENDVRFFTDYHPEDRLVPFQLFESAIFTVLAAALFALAFTWVRRARRV
ncbi:ABC transporter permease [Saccharothrix saharensis]|uniref:ABC transporter permease n=1 Tax=Saccharothrix saharensis TaxID=571190 RepID=UPI00367776B3